MERERYTERGGLCTLEMPDPNQAKERPTVLGMPEMVIVAGEADTTTRGSRPMLEKATWRRRR